MTGNIIPSRITEARESRALSMADLADSVGITRQSISKYERGIISPSNDVLQSMSRHLDFPIDFFYKSDLNTTSVGSSLFFRSNSNISKKVKSACDYRVKWANEIKKYLAKYVEFLNVDIPTISNNYEDFSEVDIEELSLEIRNQWKLNDDPVGDLVGILENRGAIVSQLAPSENCPFRGIDAFSSWLDGTPYILYHSIPKSAVRTRFSILHELGHLILHHSVSAEDSIKKDVIDFADRQADRFAAAFLLPSTSFPNDIRSTSLSSLEIIKRKWGVSFSTIIRRCEALHLLTENQIDYLKRQMTTKKYWYKEPLDDTLKVEGPEMLRDAILMLADKNIVSRDRFLNSSALSIDDIRKLCSLPDDFFSGYDNRQKPILKVII